MRILLSFILAVSLPVADLIGQERITDSEEARQVFEEVDDRRTKITYETSKMEMVIVDSRGRTRTRIIRSFINNEDETSRSLLVFESPGSVRGTGFLSLSENSDEVQKLYLPGVGRIQTITAAEKADRFMGSDFTYEDLGDQDPDDYEFDWMESGDEHYLIRASKIESPQYAWVEFTIHNSRYTLEMAEYFNEDGEIIKRLVAENFENVFEDVWSPRKMTMYDLRDDRRTELTWSERTINEPIPDWRFTERGLRRGLN